MLRELDHPSIPKYLGSFETDDGFCLVTEFKDAQPLSVLRSFTPEEVRQLAIRILQVLVYLQDRFPVIIHRDIKPENILIDAESNI